MAVTLTISTAGREPQSITLDLPRIVLGRGAHADVRLPSRAVSELHAVLLNDKHEVTILDEGSTNGTRVNGQPLPRGRRKVLHDGSLLTFALHLGWMTVRFSARVEVATPARTLLWVASGAGVTGRHAFHLDAKPNGTFVRQHESFSGPGVLFFRLARFDVASGQMFQQNLKGLKRMAERSA